MPHTPTQERTEPSPSADPFQSSKPSESKNKERQEKTLKDTQRRTPSAKPTMPKVISELDNAVASKPLPAILAQSKRVSRVANNSELPSIDRKV